MDQYNSKTDGTVISTMRFEEELKKQGHTVRIVATGASGDDNFELKASKYSLVAAIAKKSNMRFAKYNKKVLTEAFKDADLVHFLMPFRMDGKALRLAKKMGIPVSCAFHVHPDNLLKNGGFKNPPKILTKAFFWFWKKRFYDLVDHIHCPSEFAMLELLKHNYKAKPYVISNGVAPQFVPKKGVALSKELPVCDTQKLQPDKNFEILMIGRLAPEKRQDLLIKAVEGSKYKDKINITFAGSGPLAQKYKDMAKVLPNAPDFAFLPQDKLLDKIHASDLYIHAADVEIEGMSCIEAFAAGLVPVIGNAEKSATKNFVLDKRCSFEAGSENDLRQKIEYWIQNPQELNAMKEQYIEYSKNFKLENSARQLVDMFKDAIASHKNYKSKMLAKKQDTCYTFDICNTQS